MNRLTPDARFERYHAECPELYQLFERFARELKNAGMSRYSADGILHLIRHHMIVVLRHEGGRKINNDFAAPLARKLMNECPEFAGFFELRETRSDRELAEAHADGRLFR